MNVNTANMFPLDISTWDTVMKWKAGLKGFYLKARNKALLASRQILGCFVKNVSFLGAVPLIILRIISHLQFSSSGEMFLFPLITSLGILCGFVCFRFICSGWQIRMIWRAEYFTDRRNPHKTQTWVQIKLQLIWAVSTNLLSQILDSGCGLAFGRTQTFSEPAQASSPGKPRNQKSVSCLAEQV